jgi:protease YdgD
MGGRVAGRSVGLGLGAVVLLALLVAQAAAQTRTPVERRALTAAEAAGFRAVGRLSVGGARFCTATLVADRAILTAAHCLYHPRTREPVPVGDMRFAAGFRLGHYAAQRVVVRAVEAEGFALREAPELADLAADVALLELGAPVSGVAPVVIGAMGAAPATIVSYARDRSEAPSIAAPCAALAVAGGEGGSGAGRVAALDCGADFGASGAPVFEGEGAGMRLVGVVSAIGEVTEGPAVSLAVAVAPLVGAMAEELGIVLGADASGGGSGTAEGLE